MEMLLSLLLFVLILGLIFWIVQVIPLPPPFKTAALVILGIIAIWYLLGLLGVLPGSVPRLH